MRQATPLHRLEGKGPTTYAAGRRCRVCDTPLSRYNRRDTCHLHSPRTYPRVRGMVVRTPDG